MSQQTETNLPEKTAVRFPYNRLSAEGEASLSAPFSNREKIKKIGISDADIVPDEVQNVLISIRDNIRSNYFTIGDLANILVRKSAERGLPVTQQRVFDAVGKFCGKTGRTVRYYAETSAFYDEDIRSEYDILPFAFFVYARSFGHPKCFDVLDFAMDRPYITLDALRTHFTTIMEERLPSYDDGGAPAPPMPYKNLEAKDFKMSVFISNVSSMIDSLESLLQELELPDGVRSDILCSISTIRDSMPAVIKASRGYGS